MDTFWIVMKLELVFTWRNWATWLVALAMIFIGVLAADNNLNQPWGVWSQFIFCGLFLTLILVFTTGNQLNRDRERRLDGVILSTSVSTPTYVLAKYSASLLSLLSLAGFSLLAAIVTDQFYHVPQQMLVFSPAVYPALGPQPYLLGWAWLMLVPIIFGAAFMLACTTLARGKRVVAYIATLPIWIIPFFMSSPPKNDFFDITGISFIPFSDPATTFWFDSMMKNPGLNGLPTAQYIQQIMSLSRADVPPAPTIHDLLVNRLFFLGIAVILLGLTIIGTQRMRRNA